MAIHATIEFGRTRISIAQFLCRKPHCATKSLDRTMRDWVDFFFDTWSTTCLTNRLGGAIPPRPLDKANLESFCLLAVRLQAHGKEATCGRITPYSRTICAGIWRSSIRGAGTESYSGVPISWGRAPCTSVICATVARPVLGRARKEGL